MFTVRITELVHGPDEHFLPFLGQTVSSTILKSALNCSRKIMIAVLKLVIFYLDFLKVLHTLIRYIRSSTPGARSHASHLDSFSS